MVLEGKTSLDTKDSKFIGGLALLGPDDTALLRILDDTFRGWGIHDGAAEISAPPLYPVDELANLDVYVNFPHLALVAGGLETPSDGPQAGAFSGNQAERLELGLSTATCFGAYILLEGNRVDPNTLLTLVNRCFRNEKYFDGLNRLLSFQMREVVAVGTYDHTQSVIARFTDRIRGFMERLALEFDVEAATDPFFLKDDGRAILQKIEPVKFEFQVNGLAIASTNSHRNFFGERCRISVEGDDSTAFTGCVAFGLERWLKVLIDRFGTSKDALTAVRDALNELDPV